MHYQGITAALLISLLLTGCGKRELREYEGIKIPEYDRHSYQNGSVAAQPGVRIRTPSGNVIIVTIKPAELRDRQIADPTEEMNGRVAASLSASKLESIVANVSEQNHVKIIGYDTWRKNDRNSEVQTKLPLLISSNRTIFLPKTTVDIECLLIKGDIAGDLQTIKYLTQAIVMKNTPK